MQAMRRGFAAAIIGVALLTAGAAASESHFTYCPVSGVMAGGTLEARGLRCHSARSLILGFMEKSSEQGVSKAYVNGFLCKNVPPNIQPGGSSVVGTIDGRVSSAPRISSGALVAIGLSCPDLQNAPAALAAPPGLATGRLRFR